MTLSSPVVHPNFDGKYCLHLQGRTVRQATQGTGEAAQFSLFWIPENGGGKVPPKHLRNYTRLYGI